ncbi:MAG: MerR family transcriptional regulator [Pseudobdellovibrionaceae bacterium]|jgi:MerR family copper efflux transcriptional regulator
MKINEFAKATGLSARAIRLYEQKGLLKSLRDSSNKYRIYQQDQIELAKNIKQLRNLGFPVSEIFHLLKIDPNLRVEKIQDEIKRHLIRINHQIQEMQIQAQETQNLLSSLNKGKTLTAKQKSAFRGFSQAAIKKSALDYANSYFKRSHLGVDEELQMLTAAYSSLFLTFVSQGSTKELAKGHRLIAKCLNKIGEDSLAKRHLATGIAYEKM